MPLVLLRVDDRLVHGQVVESWLPDLKVDLVVVVSDAAAADPVMAALMKMALPPAVGLMVLSVGDAPSALVAPQLASRRALVLVPGPGEALALLEKGVVADRVNVGGLHFTVGKVQLGRALFLDEKDKAALRAIAARGVRLEGRALPSDPDEDLAPMLGGQVITSAGAAGTVAALELDAASVGPFLLSRPFVVGPLIGWALGDPWAGAALGAAFEAMTLEEMPLGGSLDFSAPVAAGVSACLAAGPSALPGEASFLAGLGAGWMHARLERFLRRGRGTRARRAETALAAGRDPRLGAEIAGALASQFAATFALALMIVAAGGPLLSQMWPAVPEFLRAGARASYLTAPWFAAGSLAASLVRRA